MDNALQTLLCWQFILFCLSVSAATYFIRVIVDYILECNNIKAAQNHFWTELALPLLPLIIATVGAIAAKQYPYPDDIHSMSGRIAFGLCAGLLSGLVWRVVKAIIGSKLASMPNMHLPEIIAPDVGEGPSANKKSDDE